MAFIRKTWLPLGILGLFVVSTVHAQGRDATPAVVNPPIASPLRATICLNGAWDFAVDPQKVGDEQRWFAPDATLPGETKLQVPGCWEAQGIGGPNATSSATVEQVSRSLVGSYKGAAWYRRQVAIPLDWKGQQVWLKIGGVHAQGWFWVNGTFVGHNKCYCGTYKYNITDLVKPGEPAVVVAKVRNDVPSHKGMFSWVQHFGGLYRDVEIEATPDVSIDDAYVSGDFDRKSATIHVAVRNDGTLSKKTQYQVDVVVSTLDGVKAGSAVGRVAFAGGDAKQVELALDVPLAPFHPWHPDSPNLYKAEIVLKADGRPIDGWVERFGVRKWEVRGGNFYFNNQKFFVRGYGDDFMYPLTISSPASREFHRKNLKVAKQFGFVYARHHTHCEVPEFFEAADELGMMVQPELPYYGNIVSGADASFFQPKKDLEELYRHYRRYVSLSTYCTGNEGHLGAPLDREIYQLAKRLDPTRLMLHQDGGQNTPENSDFFTGPILPWQPGTVDGARPFFAHEYLNLATNEDPRLAPKYVGAVRPPVTAEAFQQELDRNGLSWDWGMACLDAGNQLAKIYQKRGLEQARLDPVCDGYSYWTIVDVGSPSAQGLFNQFWEPKASRAEDFQQFNGPTAILVKMTPDAPVLGSYEDRKIEWWISHFGTKPLVGKTMRWKIVGGNTNINIHGEIDGVNAEPGDVKKIGEMTLASPYIDGAKAAKLVAEIEGESVANSWDLWIFPSREPVLASGKDLAASSGVFRTLEPRYPGITLAGKPESAAKDILLTNRLDDEALAALDRGKTVVLLQLGGPKPGVALGWWGLCNQRGTAIARHPAFGAFPHDGYMGEQFFRIIGGTVPLTDELFRDVEPLMVGRGNEAYLAHVFQTRASGGKLFGTGLNLLAEYPESRYLLDQFLNYVRSNQFKPKASLNDARLKKYVAEFGRPMNGWAETLKGPPVVRYGSFRGELPMRLIHNEDNETELVWKTQPVPAALDAAKPFEFRWVGAMGFISQPPCKFTLFLGDKKLLDFEVVHENATWKSADGAATLTYAVKSKNAEDSSGVMMLTVPGAWLKAGEPATLRVTTPQTGGRRWFGVYEEM